MQAWVFVALIWYHGGLPWPDVIWSFPYQEKAHCTQEARTYVASKLRIPQVARIAASPCFQWMVTGQGKDT